MRDFKGILAKIPARISSYWPFWLAALLLAAGQALYLGLSLVSLDKFKDQSDRLIEDVVLKSQVERLTTVADLGLSPNSYMGLKKDLQMVADRSDAELAAIIGTDGQIIFGLGIEGFLTLPPGPIAPNETLNFNSDDRLWRIRPIFDRQSRIWGLLGVSPNETDITEQTIGLATTTVGGTGLFVLVLSAGLTGLAMIWGVRRQAKGRLSRIGLYCLILAPFLLGQGIFTLSSFPELVKRHLELSRSQAHQVLSNLVIDLERISSQGVDLAKIADLKNHLAKLLGSLPDAEAIVVKTPNTHLSYPKIAKKPPSDLLVSAPIDSNGQAEVWLSPSAIRATRIDLALDNLFLTLVTVLAIIEMARVLAGDLAARLRTASTSSPASFTTIVPRERQFKLERLRLVIFIAIMCVDSPLSFTPLKMAAISPADSVIPRDVLLGLPVAMGFLMTGLGMLISGRFGIGQRVINLVTIGLVVAALGALTSCLTNSPLLFVMALGLSGFGYGLINLPFNLIASSSLGPERQGEAFSDIAASFFAGGTCGCLIGGILADRFGFDFVYGLSAIIFGLLAFSWKFLSPMPPAIVALLPTKRGTAGMLKGLWIFLSRRRPLSLILLCISPAAAAAIGLMNYYLPLRLFELGYGPSMAGRLNFLMSIIIIVLAPALGRAMDRSGRLSPWLVGAGLAAAMSSISYLAWPTLLGAILAMVFLGISQSITESGHSAAIISLPEASELGSSESLGLAATISRVSQTTGPVILGGALGIWGTLGLGVFGGLIALASLAYGYLNTSSEPKK